MRLESKASLQIQKPIAEVFQGIVDPNIMTKYFISESSGPMETGKELLWKFPEFVDRYPVKDIIIETNLSISFVWDPETKVTITLEELPDKSTLVKVKESDKDLNENNLKWALSNSSGWANFLACLKAYLEYGINLRKGAFEYMRKN